MKLLKMIISFYRSTLKWNSNNFPLRAITSTTQNRDIQAVIGMGSNMGDSIKVFNEALAKLSTIGQLTNTSFLYQSHPKYYPNQPTFFNAACLITTNFTASALLDRLKQIEVSIGRQISFRNGPRLIDLDIIFYGSDCFELDSKSSNTFQLTIPHPRLQERAFVLGPLLDMIPHFTHPRLQLTIEQLWQSLPQIETSSIQRVMPLGMRADRSRRLVQWNTRYIICGILNATPDSFSDGGRYGQEAESAVHRVLSLLNDGADMIDIGGESTRPGATEVPEQDEIERVIPIIKAIRARGIDCVLSVDTRRASVAAQALSAGADVINDVSGGRFDPRMHQSVKDFDASMVYMHMRGTPQTMLLLENTRYDDPITDVALELTEQLNHGLTLGIPRWAQLVDPGIGFAKDAQTSKSLLQPNELKRLRNLLGGRPMMVGLSRKRFLEKMLIDAESTTSSHINSLSNNIGKAPRIKISPDDRDFATVAGCLSVLLCSYDIQSTPNELGNGPIILRVHNVRAVKDACDIFSSILHH